MKTSFPASLLLCFLAIFNAFGQEPGAPIAAPSVPPAEVAATPAKGKAEHIVLVVWDGFRPDSINDQDSPTLAKLAREGVTFMRHHPVFPSSTEVNGTAMATGCYPGHSGLIGNREFRPAIDPLRTVATELVPTIRKGDEVTGGKYLLVPTLPELLQGAGFRTFVTGTKNVVILMDRAARSDRPGDVSDLSVNLFGGVTLPPAIAELLATKSGAPFPQDIHLPNVLEDQWTTHALTTDLWNLARSGVPKFSVLWLSDPDFTQHQFGVNSPQAHRAVASSDSNLATVLARLDELKVRDKTDVFVVSDHGFSTIEHPVDVAKILVSGGFVATREYKAPPQPGDILVNGLGGCVFLYVAGHDAPTIERAVAFLEGCDFAGALFTRTGVPGTFTTAALHIDSPDSPDIVVTMRWSDEKSPNGTPGIIYSDGGRKTGQGTHATLSRTDMHNTLVASGPDFRTGYRDELPSGNTDLAPTIAHLLGLPIVQKMDGRVLTEALTEGAQSDTTAPAEEAVTERAEAGSETGNIHWHQYLQISHYGGVDYFDGGNSASDAPIKE